MRASTRGSVGTAKGRRVMITDCRSSPGTSTPSQKVLVPRRTDPFFSLKSSMARAIGISPCLISVQGSPEADNSACVRFSMEWLVKRTKAFPDPASNSSLMRDTEASKNLSGSPAGSGKSFTVYKRACSWNRKGDGKRASAGFSSPSRPLI